MFNEDVSFKHQAHAFCNQLRRCKAIQRSLSVHPKDLSLRRQKETMIDMYDDWALAGDTSADDLVTILV